MTALPRFSYFEFWDLVRDVYVSLFPTDKTLITDVRNFPQEGDKVFPSVYGNDTEFMHMFHAMKENDFGFFDNFWFIPKTQTHYTLDYIKSWMDSLVYVPNELTPSYKRYTIVSKLDPNFKLIVYVKNQSLPQEAIDVIPVFTNGETKFVALGHKKVSPLISITDGNIYNKVLFSTGKYGFVIFGEHLEPSEKSSMNELASQFQGTPIEMKERQISSSLRALFEEGGFKVDNDMGQFFYVHRDSRPGRDDRYWTYNTDEFVFGYNRESVSHTVLVLMKGDMPKMMNDPADADECDKGIIMTASDAVEILLDSGAFFSHAFQLCITLNSTLFTPASNFVGKTYQQASQEYNGPVRVAVCYGKFVFVPPKDYAKERMNVSVAEDGKIDRILGFY